jgi:5-dehydro-2-deoxygluconokinase
VLGAGDGFMSGLLKGWLDDEDWPTTLKYANACGALAVSRHGCAPAYPSWQELNFLLERGVCNPALRHDRELEQIHWSTNRKGDWPVMRVFAFDHRMQMEALADELGAGHERIGIFKQLCLDAALKVAAGRGGYGILCDGRLGQEALYRAAGQGLWIGRPVEVPGSRPLELEIGPDLGSDLAEWPAEHVVKVLCFYHPEDDEATKRAQEGTVIRLADAARANGLEFLLEIIPSRVGPVGDDTTARVIQRFYDVGVFPDWWKLEPMTSPPAWALACAAIERNDPHTRGIVVLGLEAELTDLRASFAQAARFDLVKGFAVGRSIFAAPARKWLSGAIGDAEAVEEMAGIYAELCAAWDDARRDAQTGSRP